MVGKGRGRTSRRTRAALFLLHTTIRHERPAYVNRVRGIQHRRRLLHTIHDRVRPVQRAEVEVMLIR